MSNHDITMYKTRFLFPSTSPINLAGNAEDEDKLYKELYEPIPIIRNYRNVCFRTFEYPLKWYFLVFAPMNKAYINEPEWFNTKGIDACRKKISTDSESFFISKEIDAEKVHINALVLTNRPLDLLNGKFAVSRYRIYASECIDAIQTFDYITKEFKTREPILFKDYLYKLPIDHSGKKLIQLA